MNYLIFLTILSFVNWSANGQVCVDYPFKPGPNPTPTLPLKYSTRVEINMKEDQKTREMRAYYDMAKRKAALEIKDNNIVNKLIFNYETDEIYSLSYRAEVPIDLAPIPDYQPQFPTTCQTYQLSTNLPLNYYFGFTGTSENLYPDSPSTFFRFFPQAYDGEETIRNIPCEAYISCQYNPATLANYTIRHLLSKSSFAMGGANSSYSRIPIRATYQGSALKPDGTNKMFTNVYEYHDFRLDFDSDNTFLTPGGVFCEDRKHTFKKPPQINSNFRYSEEVTTNGLTTYITDLIYDQDLQVVRYETRNKYDNNTNSAPSEAFSKDPHVYVHDYTIGVSYKTNVNSGRCKIEPIDLLSFDLDQSFTQSQLDSGNGFIIRLKSPSSLLELDADYINTGERLVDGIPSDLFIAKVQVSKNVTAINEYSFTKSNFEVESSHDFNRNVPNRLAKGAPESNFNTISTFYNFETTEQNLNAFEISQCYQERSLIQFRLIFKPKDEANALLLKRIDLNKNLKKDIYKLISKLTEEISLRFSIPKLAINDDGNLIVRSAILPGPAPLDLFKKMDLQLLTSTFYIGLDKASDEECAIACLARNDCLSFDFSPKRLRCYLNKKHTSEGTIENNEFEFSHYSRYSSNVVKFSDKTKIWSDLQIRFNSALNFDFSVQDFVGQKFTLQMEAQTAQEVSTNENRFGNTALLFSYHLKKQNFKFSSSKDHLYAKINIDDCAKHCTDEIGMPCNSFHYCYLTAECVVSKDFLPTDDSSYTPDSHCDIYEKDPLAHYNFFSTKATINPKDKKFTNVKNPNECAQKCDNEAKFNCKSFNHCPISNECYLSETHLVDSVSGSSSQDLVCNHYSRKYIQDFTYINTKEIKLTAEIVLKDASLDICSRECVNADGFNCKSFDYCPESKTCLLNSGQQQVTSNVQNLQVDSCAHYRREYFSVTSFYSSEKNKDSSESVLTALSIVFAIIGCAVGAVGSVFLINKYFS